MIEIREMIILDYQDVINLWAECEGMTLREADSKENIEKYITKNQGLSYIALTKIENQTKIIGAVLAGTDGRRGYLQHLAVHTKYRTQGIGKQLISKVINSLHKIGISKTHLLVHNDNINAQIFYAKLGWTLRDDIKMFSYNTSSNVDI